MQSILIAQYPDSPLNVDVSCFKNTKATIPRKMNVLNWLDNPHNEREITKLRQIPPEKYGAAKLLLPAITPSGSFTKRNAQCLIKHSGLIQFDIDNKDNAGRIDNFLNLKEQISKIRNVAYCGLSASGLGFWGLIPIAYPERHKQHFVFIEQLFASFNIIIDDSCSDTSRLRIMSYDPLSYFNHDAEVLTSFAEQKPQDYDVILEKSKDSDHEQRMFEAYINIISNNRIDITGNYNDWFNIGCSLANTFGISGLRYFHAISRFHRTYNSADTDRQFAACLSGNYSHTIGTFYYHCKNAGIQRMHSVVYWKGQYEFF